MSILSITREFSPWASRTSFLVGVVGVSFAFGAYWGRLDTTAAAHEPAMTVAALPVVPSAAQAEAMTPRLPPLSDAGDDASPTF